MAKTLTLGETAAVEDMSGQPLTDMQDPHAKKGKLAASVVTVLKRRSEPEFTLAQAMEMDAEEAGALITEYFQGAADPLVETEPTS